MLILPHYHAIASASTNQCNVHHLYEDFFPKTQPYSAVRMDKPSQLENAITTESLLELGSVLDTSLRDWNEELSTGSNKTCRSAWQLTVTARPLD